MEAIPLVLASTAKAVLFGAVMPEGISGVHSDALAPTALDSHPVALSAPSNTQEAAPVATPPVTTPPVAPPVETPTPADVGHEIPTPGDMAVSGPAPESATIGASEHSTVTEVSGSATDTSSATQAIQATPAAAESDLPKVAVDTDVADVTAKAAKTKDVAFDALQTSHVDKVAASKPIMDETTQMMYINQKIHDFFSGGISPSDVSSVVKESVTVLREFDKLNQ